MNTPDIRLYQEELEELTGKMFSGDITPLVYELLKTSPDKENLIRKLGGKVPKKPKSVVQQTTCPSFDDLFANGIELR